MSIAGYLIAITIDVLFPVALAIWVRRRFRVRWRYLAMGAVVFAVSQLLTRIPAMKLVEYFFLADTLKSSDTAMMVYLGVAAVLGHTTFSNLLGQTAGMLATEGVVALMAILSLAIILRLRPTRRAAA